MRACTFHCAYHNWAVNRRDNQSAATCSATLINQSFPMPLCASPRVIGASVVIDATDVTVSYSCRSRCCAAAVSWSLKLPGTGAHRRVDGSWNRTICNRCECCSVTFTISQTSVGVLCMYEFELIRFMTFFQDEINKRKSEFHKSTSKQLVYFVTKLNRFKKYTM